MGHTTKRFFRQKAQTAAELAVFGAILIFVVGGIVRAAVNASLQQQQQLAAMRLAMRMSFETSETGDIASRNVASVLFFEDRLTASSAKYGAIDRTPFMIQASATHNRNLFMPIGFGDTADLPVMDVFVNGQHFAFTTAAFRQILFQPGATEAIKRDPSGFVPDQLVPQDWDPNCAHQTVTDSYCKDLDCIPACATYTSLPPCTPPGPPITHNVPVGCARVYTIIDNHPLIPEWCDDVTRPCPPDNLTADQRFDLDRGHTQFNKNNTPTPSVTIGERAFFSWEWYAVMAFDETFRQGIDNGTGWGNTFTPGPITTLNFAEGITLEDPDCESDCKAPKNTSVDVDGDLQLETVLSKTIDPMTAVITSLGVMDSQDGDLDFSISEQNSNKPLPGFTKDTSMYTFVSSPGTYARIDEGKLFDPAGKQFIRTARKKDQIDLVERVFQLSNNTGAFCQGGAPTANANGITNDVEACGDCFTSANIKKTCMDEQALIIFVRSRIQDLRGHKWVTDVSNDPYMDFATPPVP